MGIKHAFNSTKPDAADLTLINPSNWNAEHVLDGLVITGDLTAPSATKNSLRVKAYSPAFELMDKDGTQNYYIGINNDDGRKLYIGRGYGPAQGVAPAIIIDTTDAVKVGNAASPGAALSVASSGSWAGGDWLAWFRRANTVANNEALIRLEHFSNDQVPLPIFTGIANRGTIASPVGISTDDYLIVLDGRGYDGSAVDHSEYAVGISDSAAQIAFRAVSAWSGTSHPSYMHFKVTPTGGITPIEVVRMCAEGSATYPIMKIGQDGQVQISIKKCTSSAVAPGAGFAQLRVEAGTNAGTLKIVAYAGTSATGVTVVDNIGAGN